jgi:hypothetical protein
MQHFYTRSQEFFELIRSNGNPLPEHGNPQRLTKTWESANLFFTNPSQERNVYTHAMASIFYLRGIHEDHESHSMFIRLCSLILFVYLRSLRPNEEEYFQSNEFLIYLADFVENIIFVIHDDIRATYFDFREWYPLSDTQREENDDESTHTGPEQYMTPHEVPYEIRRGHLYQTVIPVEDLLLEWLPTIYDFDQIYQRLQGIMPQTESEANHLIHAFFDLAFTMH